MIPAFILICRSAAERKRQVSEAIEGNATRLSRFLASNLERDLSEGEGYLRATAELLRGNQCPVSACSEMLRGIAGESSVYSIVGVADRQGRILCSTDPHASLSGLGDMEWFRALDPAGGFSVGFDFNGKDRSGSSIAMALPVTPGGKDLPGGGRYVFALMDLEWLNRLAESSRLPPGSAISITNRKGDAVARYPEPEKWVGKARQSGTGMHDGGATEGVRFAEGIDGVKRLYAYTTVRGKGNLVVNVGVSRDAMLEPANRAFRNQLAALCIVAVLSILAAWFGADVFLLKQVRTLIQATRQLEAGNLQARSTLSYGSGELGELAKAFDEMAEMLEWREAQLRESDVEREDPLAMLVVLAECVPEPFLIMDETFSILAGNQEASRLSGLTDEELIGQALHRLFPGIPIGEIAGWIAAPAGPDGRQVYRLRAEIARLRRFGGPVQVDISLMKAAVSRRTFVLALLKQTLEPFPGA